MSKKALTFYVAREEPSSKSGRVLLDEMAAVLATFSGNSGQSRARLNNTGSVRGAFFIARTSEGQLLGCAGFRRFDYSVAELTSIYSRHPGSGIGGTLLVYLEASALTLDYHSMAVELHGPCSKAMRLLERNGYQPSNRFGGYKVRQGICSLEKSLLPRTA